MNNLADNDAVRVVASAPSRDSIRCSRSGFIAPIRAVVDDVRYVLSCERAVTIPRVSNVRYHFPRVTVMPNVSAEKVYRYRLNAETVLLFD